MLVHNLGDSNVFKNKGDHDVNLKRIFGMNCTKEGKWIYHAQG